MKNQIDDLMKQFNYDDKRISHVLDIFDDYTRFIRDYDDQFDTGRNEYENFMLVGYRNSAFGILLSLFHLGHITTGDFHERMHALNSTYFARVGRNK